MNKKIKKYLPIIILLLLTVLGYLFIFEDDVKISDIKWSCDWEETKGNCFITYKIENTTNEVLFPNIHIRAQNVRHGKYGSVKVVGEKSKRIELPPSRSTIMEDNLIVNKHPTVILVFAR